MTDRKILITIEGRDNASGPLRGVGGALGNVAQIAAGILSSQVFTKLASEVAGFAQGSVDAASDLLESTSKVSEIYGESAEALLSWAADSAQAVGLSKGAALDAASGFAIFAKAAGLAGDDLNKFSQTNLTLAADMASFFNTSIEEAATAIQSAFRGETEPIRRFGVLLDDASLRAKALELGIISTTKNALTPQQKVLAANALIWQQTADAQGDFARTSGGFANQQRIFQAQLENVQASLGSAFLPILTRAMGFINSVGIPALENFVTGFKGFFASITDTGAIRGVFDDVSAFFEQFRPGFEGLINFWKINGPGITETVQSTFGRLAEIGQDLISRIVPFLVEQFNKISAWFIANGPLIQEFAGVVGEKFVAFGQVVQAAWGVIQPILGGLLDLVLGLGKTAMQLATGDWAGAWQTIQTTAANVGQAIWQGVQGFLDMIAVSMGSSLSEIIAVWSSNWEQLKEIVGKIGEIIKNWVSEKIGSLVNTFNQVRDAIQGVISWVKNLAASLMSLALPSWLIPGSPTPFELGLRGINDAMESLSRAAMPAFSGQLGGFAGLPQLAGAVAGSGTFRAAGAGAGAGMGGNIYLTVQMPTMSMGDEENFINELIPVLKRAKQQGGL